MYRRNKTVIDQSSETEVIQWRRHPVKNSSITTDIYGVILLRPKDNVL